MPEDYANNSRHSLSLVEVLEGLVDHVEILAEVGIFRPALLHDLDVLGRRCLLADGRTA